MFGLVEVSAWMHVRNGTFKMTGRAQVNQQTKQQQIPSNMHYHGGQWERDIGRNNQLDPTSVDEPISKTKRCAPNAFITN